MQPAHRGTVVAHLQREHRPARDLERQVLHGSQQIDLFAGLCREGGERVPGAAHDVPASIGMFRGARAGAMVRR